MATTPPCQVCPRPRYIGGLCKRHRDLLFHAITRARSESGADRPSCSGPSLPLQLRALPGPAGSGPGSAHGTQRGYLRHQRQGSTPCTLCREAHNAYNAEWRRVRYGAGR